MPRWLPLLEKKLDEFALEGSHQKFQLFLTSDRSNAIPIGLLNRSIKVTNAPPSGLKANLKRAWCSFSKDYVNELDMKTRQILFGLCHFHAVLMERKMYGTLGYNMNYPFSLGDLRDSTLCLCNYMENVSGPMPWADLKYIFGEIMYGGHIVNDNDRLLANTYLDFFMQDGLFDEMQMFPFVDEKSDKKMSFKCPGGTGYDRYVNYIDDELKVETPIAFGLHPNAEINFRTQQSEELFLTILELQPHEDGDGVESESPQDAAYNILVDVVDKFQDKYYDLEEISNLVDEIGPYQNVFLQECDAFNKLLAEIIRSLNELSLGFAGELTMSEPMDQLMQSLFLDRVPAIWTKLAWPSQRSLGGWLANVSDRLTQIDEWTQNPLEIPRVTWLSGFVNPQAFLTAIQQVTAQSNQWELDKLAVATEVTKNTADDCHAPSRDGAYICGFSLQGARWNKDKLHVDKAKPKEMFCPMPVINCKAINVDKTERLGIYECPVYKTEQRGPTFVFNAQLKTKSPPARWVMAGVAMIMDVAAA